MSERKYKILKNISENHWVLFASHSLIILKFSPTSFFVCNSSFVIIYAKCFVKWTPSFYLSVFAVIRASFYFFSLSLIQVYILKELIFYHCFWFSNLFYLASHYDICVLIVVWIGCIALDDVCNFSKLWMLESWVYGSTCCDNEFKKNFNLGILLACTSFMPE